MNSKMDTWERELLRAETGELSKRRLRRLHAAMARDPSLKSQQVAWLRLKQTLQDEANVPMEAAVRQRIMAAARREQPTAGRLSGLFPLRPLPAMASLLLLAAGLWVVSLTYRTPPAQPVTSHIAEMPLFWDEELDWEISLLSEEVRGVFSDLNADRDLDTDALATELLKAEGLQI